MKKENGITLIALVITIIVLLILAGISISMLSGDNGILQQASKAKDDTNNRTVEEKIKLAAVDAIMKGKDLTKIETEEELKEALESNDVELEGDITKDETTGNFTLKVNGIEYIVHSTGKVEEKLILPKWTYSEDENSITNGKVKFDIGEAINYSVTADGTTYDDWKVLGVNNEGNVMIISTEAIETVTLTGTDNPATDGYTNAETIVNNEITKYKNDLALSVRVPGSNEDGTFRVETDVGYSYNDEKLLLKLAEEGKNYNLRI